MTDNKYIILNYQSFKGIDGNPSYDFWFTSSLIRVIGDKPFSRGDIAEIQNIRTPSPTEWIIDVHVIGDPAVDPEAKEVASEITEEIPTLMFATNKIYLDKSSDVHVYGSDNVEILLNCSSSMNNNKAYTIAVLITGKQGRVFGVDQTHGTGLEWLITDNP